MSDDDKFDFEILRVARLRTVDVAKLLRLSRVTVSLWMNGRGQPHRLLRARVRNFLDAVQEAVQAEQLPVPHDIRRRERGFFVQRALDPYFTLEMETDRDP